MSKIDRDFKISDAEMQQHAEIVVVTLPSDMPAFMAFDSTITFDYIPVIQSAIDDAKALPTDNVMIDEMAEQTLLVENAVNVCYADYKTIAYFVRKAYADNTAIQNQFGLNDIEKARKSQPKMIVFMNSFAKTSAKYQDKLVQAGCNQSLIAGLPDKAATLEDANIAQEKFKNDRAINANNRILALNKVYKLLQPLHDVAMNIYQDDPVRLSIYTMPQTNPPAAPPDKPAQS